jgi:transposase
MGRGAGRPRQRRHAEQERERDGEGLVAEDLDEPWASRSKCAPSSPSPHNAHRHGTLAAIRLGLSNGRLEGLNSKIRPISHRSFGFHSAAALIALVYLCCAASSSTCRDDFHPQIDRSTA